MTELSPKLAHRASNSLTCQTSLCTRSLKMSANLCGDLIHDVMYQQVNLFSNERRWHYYLSRSCIN